MSVPCLSAAGLRAAGRNLPACFAVTLDDGSTLIVESVLRLLPEKRISGLARWKGQPVFVKLFLAKGAVRHGHREQQGLMALAAAVDAPRLLHAGAMQGEGFAVVSEFLADAVPLDVDAGEAALLAAFSVLGKLHRSGWVHVDGHLGNFLQHGSRLLMIDGDGVKKAASAADCLDNLALFCSQLPVSWQDRAVQIIAAYGSPVAPAALLAATARMRQQRLRHYLAKVVRDCTEFAVSTKRNRFLSVVRGEQAALQALLDDPDAAIAAGTLLKDGGSATVARVEVDGRSLVIKRYNLKNWRHALSRAWRPSRAWRSWVEGHRLHFLGIATPRPLALIEARYGLLRRRAWLLTEYVSGEPLLERYASGQLPAEAELASLETLFDSLQRYRISHGDMKASNLLWANGQPLLIDLDAMRQHRSSHTFAKAWQKDTSRFLANWAADSPLALWLRRRLP